MKGYEAAAVQERKAPFFLGIDVGKYTHYAYLLDANGTPCLPKAIAFANTRAGYARLEEHLQESTAPATPAEVTVGCEATGPYWLNLYEALNSQGYRVVVLNPLYVKARRGTTLRGTKTDTVDAQLIAAIGRVHRGGVICKMAQSWVIGKTPVR